MNNKEKNQKHLAIKVVVFIDGKEYKEFESRILKTNLDGVISAMEAQLEDLDVVDDFYNQD